MYFIGIKKLKEELVSPESCDARCFPYFLGVITCDAMMGLIMEGRPAGAYHHVTGMLFAAISLLGTFGAFKANGGLKGERFLSCFFALQWVLGVRFFLAALLVTRFGLKARGGLRYGLRPVRKCMEKDRVFPKAEDACQIMKLGPILLLSNDGEGHASQMMVAFRSLIR